MRKMDKKKNKKLDLVWIIPEIVGSAFICIAAVNHIYNLQPPQLGMMNWVFQCSLVIAVLDIGFKGVNQGIDELKKVKF